MTATKKGSLAVVGTGIKSIAHVSVEAQTLIKTADKVVFVVSDPITKSWLAELNHTAEDMAVFYDTEKPREQTYLEMANYCLSFVRQGLALCAVYYGHPGVFVAPSHLSVRLAREEGYEATMYPGISAEDCLFSDLGFDPARKGCQTYEATDFLVLNRSFDPSSNLVLWQIGVIAQFGYKENYDCVRGLTVLRDKLLEKYPPDHQVYIYEASLFSICSPVVTVVRLADLPATTAATPISTLFVPPAATNYADVEMLKKLEIPENLWKTRANKIATLFNTERYYVGVNADADHALA